MYGFSFILASYSIIFLDNLQLTDWHFPSYRYPH